jgi:hypothetical protein
VKDDMNDIAVETTTTPAATTDVAADVIRMTWKPSIEAMTSYKTREVELCVQTIRRGAATAQFHTLYSQRTWDAALEQLGGRLPEVPAHVLKSLESMREMAAAAASVHIKFGKNGFARR